MSDVDGKPHDGGQSLWNILCCLPVLGGIVWQPPPFPGEFDGRREAFTGACMRGCWLAFLLDAR